MADRIRSDAGASSRRRFMQQAGAGSAAVAAATLGLSTQEADAATASAFDATYDIVVAGSGCGGLASALFARWQGNSAVILEKAGSIGGTTAKAAFWYWVPNNEAMKKAGIADPKPDFLKYVARLSNPQGYDPSHPRYGFTQWEYDMCAAFYDSASPAAELLATRGALPYRHVADVPDYFAELPEDKAPKGRVLVPKDAIPSMSDGGLVAVRTLSTKARQEGIPIRTGMRVTKLLQDKSGRVIGVEAKDELDATVRVRARKAVIFATGGFTHNVELRNGLSTPVFGGGASITNEGDFVPIAAALGAAMRNMNHAWMSPIVFERAVRRDPDLKCAFIVVGDSVLMVNRYGRRGLNEKFVYNERGYLMGNWDGVACEYPNLLMFVIWDQRCADRFAGSAWDDGTIPGPGQDASHVMRGETLSELASALGARLEELAPHTGGVRLAEGFAEELARTVTGYNAYARSGVDPEFKRGETPIEQFFHAATAAAAGVQGREEGEQTVFSSRDEAAPADPADDEKVPNPTMYPLSDTGPYYAAIHAPGTLDTKGGPVTDPHGRVLREDGSVIEGLYAVGNCAASASARGYLGPGITIGPLVTFGWLAGGHAAARVGSEPAPVAGS